MELEIHVAVELPVVLTLMVSDNSFPEFLSFQIFEECVKFTSKGDLGIFKRHI